MNPEVNQVFLVSISPWGRSRAGVKPRTPDGAKVGLSTLRDGLLHVVEGFPDVAGFSGVAVSAGSSPLD